MPVGMTKVWVYKLHESYPYLKPGWQFVPDADVAQLSTDKCIADVESVPQRYLPYRDRGPAVTPTVLSAPAPPLAPAAPPLAPADQTPESVYD